jgi:hypothetical protein
MVAQEVLHAKDLTMKHDRVMYLWLGQICGGGGAPVALVAGWMPNGRSVDGGPERRFDGGRRGSASYGGRRGGDSYSCGGSYGDGGTFTTGKRGTFLDIVIFVDTEDYNYDIFLITVTKEYILT